jgi:hypothetical protein
MRKETGKETTGKRGGKERFALAPILSLIPSPTRDSSDLSASQMLVDARLPVEVVVQCNPSIGHGWGEGSGATTTA